MSRGLADNKSRLPPDEPSVCSWDPFMTCFSRLRAADLDLDMTPRAPTRCWPLPQLRLAGSRNLHRTPRFGQPELCPNVDGPGSDVDDAPMFRRKLCRGATRPCASPPPLRRTGILPERGVSARRPLLHWVRCLSEVQSDRWPRSRRVASPGVGYERVGQLLCQTSASAGGKEEGGDMRRASRGTS